MVRVVKEQASGRELDHGVPFREAARFWVKLGFINFGGPTGQIAIMHQELVERKRWVSNARFFHALNFCMLLPGPEATQLAVYIGWLLHKVRGGLVAGIAFILPAFFMILGLSWVYVEHGDVSVVAGVLAGLQAAVVGIVAAAVIRIGRRALSSGVLVAIAAAAFLAIFLFRVPFPVIVGAALVIGFVGGRRWADRFELRHEGSGGGETALRDDVPPPAHARTSTRRSIRVVLVGVAIWILPLLAVALIPGTPAVVGEEAVFFSKAAMITFGGAYAVLAYINQAAVQQFGWLLPGQMVTGLGLAESTPGPLIMVTEFVGFVAAYRDPGGLDPTVAGLLGAAVATWATFAPSFIWIFLGAPYIERLRGNRALTATLASVTAAVVGVVLNLAVTFAVQTLFGESRPIDLGIGRLLVPVAGSVEVFAVAIAVASFVTLWRFRVNILWVVLGSAVAGAVRVLVA
jgi:chromate transporter